MRKITILLAMFLLLLSASGRASASGGLAPFPGTSGGAGDGAPVTTILGYVLTCSSLTVAGQTGSGHVVIDISPYLAANLAKVNVAASNGFYETTVNFAPQSIGTKIDIQIWGETNTTIGDFTPDWDGHGWSEVSYQGCPASWGSLTLPNQGVTWFNPGDGRIDGQPGDRIAVWCNTTATPPAFVVYGVGDATNGSHGFWLATFSNAGLLKAGKAGITKNAGAGNGSISAMNDGNGNFWVAWNGGIFNATGNPPFAKSFSCQF